MAREGMWICRNPVRSGLACFCELPPITRRLQVRFLHGVGFISNVTVT